MSKKGIIAAVIVVALLGAGAGFYFFYPVELEIKDTFEVGDKHTMVYDYKQHTVLTDIDRDGDEPVFEIDSDPGNSYDDIVDLIENILYLEEEDDISEAEIAEESIDTDFGKRDCIVYTITETEEELPGDSFESTAKYYIGKNNDVLYKYLYESPYVTEKTELKRSSMIIESPSGVEIKSAEDLKVGDTIAYAVFAQETVEIEEILPAEGNTPEKYKLMASDGFMTRDGVLFYLSLSVWYEVLEESEYLGTETVNTPLGRVVCDVYLLEESGVEFKIYMHNDILVKYESDFMNLHWTHSDFVTKKPMF